MHVFVHGKCQTNPANDMYTIIMLESNKDVQEFCAIDHCARLLKNAIAHDILTPKPKR